ncbi:MAG TPA: diguanylate cyclase [Pirellulales bacterium]|nr:diguanylate cyclase [Pirellulales bacterium]
MTGFVLGLLFGVSIAGGSLYAVYLWASATHRIHPDLAEAPAPVKQTPAAVKSARLPAEAVSRSPRSRAAKTPAAREEQTATPTSEAIWLGELSDRIEGEIGSHTFRLQEISAALSDARQGEPDLVLDAASRIMLANQQLQAELAAARTEIEEHRQKVKELSAEARTDPLTGLANRRAFTEDMSRRIEQWRRHKVPLSLIMVDVDHFKSINDRYTHAGGDTALRHMGDLLRGALREMDIPVRYGGEEFAIILPGTRMQEALNVAERLRATIASRGFVFEGQTIPITASLGLATASAEDTLASIVERADTALYAAKQAGRNRAYVHDGGTRQPIGSDKAVLRHPFRDLQKIAPYKVGGPLPSAGEFYPVRCYDLSVKGISFLSPAPPDFRALVVRLGNPPDVRYMISSICHVAPMVCGDEQLYRVGCTFVSRLDPDEIHPGPPEPEDAESIAGV